jgi:wyosine [tRNA(Phe)-imidazoG37] synthetase (radical SAM superfamily)
MSLSKIVQESEKKLDQEFKQFYSLDEEPIHCACNGKKTWGELKYFLISSQISLLEEVIKWVNTPTENSKGQLTISGSSEETLTKYLTEQIEECRKLLK